MARFDKYEPLLKAVEGGWSDKPSDKGGKTNCGVTLATFRDFYGADKTADDLRAMTETQWRHIMRAGYWDKCKADYINNQSVAEIFVDWCINSGTGVIKKVQAIVGTGVDGIVGQKTLAAINGFRQKCLHCRIKDARVEYYNRIVQVNPSQKVNLKGWMNRLERFRFTE